MNVMWSQITGHSTAFWQLMRTHIKEASKSALRTLCEGNSPVTGEIPAQRDSNAEKASIWWRHHGKLLLHDRHPISMDKTNTFRQRQIFESRLKFRQSLNPMHLFICRQKEDDVEDLDVGNIHRYIFICRKGHNRLLRRSRFFHYITVTS